MSDEYKNHFQKSHDKQINDSKHDEIVLWLYSKLKDFNFVKKTISSEHLNYRLSKEKFTTSGGQGERLEKEILGYESNVSIEKPLIKDHKHVIGFADLSLSVTVFTLGEETKVMYSDRETPIITEFESKGYLKEIFFEVKSSVNVGETIRQINYYNANSGYKRWYLCAPPFAASSVIVEQGIGFIPYEP